MNFKEFRKEILYYNNYPNEVKEIYIYDKANQYFNKLAESNKFIDDTYSFLSVFEDGGPSGKSFLLRLAITAFHELRFFAFKPIDEPLSIDIYNTDKDYVKMLYDTFLKNFKPNQEINTVRDRVNFNDLSFEDKHGLFNICQDIIHVGQFASNIDSSTIDLSTSDLAHFVQYNLALDLGLEDYYFFSNASYSQILTQKGLNQEARDLAAQSFEVSYDCDRPVWGAYIQVVTYTQQRSSIPSLFYVTLLMKIMQANNGLPDKIVKGLFREFAKIMRNERLYEFSQEIVLKGLKTEVYSRKEGIVLHHIYFTNLLFDDNNRNTAELVKFLYDNVEYIEGFNDENEIQPWLSMLYGIDKKSDRNYIGSRFFKSLITRFEDQVEDERFMRQHNIYKDCSTPEYLDWFKKEIVLISRSRFSNDLSIDARNLYVHSKYLLNEAFESQDIDKFLIAMIVQNDIDLSLPYHRNIENVKFKRRTEEKISSLDKAIPNTNDILAQIKFNEYEAMVWIGRGINFLYILIYSKGAFGKILKRNIDVIGLEKYIIDNISSIAMDENHTSRSGYKSIKTFDQYLQDEESLADKIKEFGDMNISDFKAPKFVYLIKDYSLDSIPSQLFINNGEFLGKSFDLVNIQSVYHGFKTDKGVFFDKNNEHLFSCWVPTLSGDYPINQLYNWIEPDLNHFGTKIHLGITPDKPLSSLVNIIIAHGADNISVSNILSMENTNLADLNKILGDGAIAILFVCHSGSYKDDYSKIRSKSLVTTLLNRGYQTVIAPSWSLNTTIVQQWLQEFLKNFVSEIPVSYCVQMANRELMKSYPYIGAYNAIVTYGNPDFRMKKMPLTMRHRQPG